MKKTVLGLAGIIVAVLISGCGGTKELSDEYITVNKYQGIEIEKEKIEEVTEEDVDKVVNHMMEGYIAQHDLPEETAITDEIVKETMSEKSTTVKEYREELRSQIESAKKESARKTEETRVWEKVMDHSKVKKYPTERIDRVKKSLMELYEGYAKEQNMEYEEYLKAVKLEEADIDEAAKASVKQELAAELIAEKEGLEPTEEEFQEALKEYAGEYKFSNVDLLLKAVSEEEMRTLVIQDRVKAWITDQCTYVKSDTDDNKSKK